MCSPVPSSPVSFVAVSRTADWLIDESTDRIQLSVCRLNLAGYGRVFFPVDSSVFSCFFAILKHRWDLRGTARWSIQLSEAVFPTPARTLVRCAGWDALMIWKNQLVQLWNFVIWLWLTVRHGKIHPFLSSVNHLFLCAIYTMAMLNNQRLLLLVLWYYGPRSKDDYDKIALQYLSYAQSLAVPQVEQSRIGPQNCVRNRSAKILVPIILVYSIYSLKFECHKGIIASLGCSFKQDHESKAEKSWKTGPWKSWNACAQVFAACICIYGLCAGLCAHVSRSNGSRFFLSFSMIPTDLTTW